MAIRKVSLFSILLFILFTGCQVIEHDQEMEWEWTTDSDVQRLIELSHNIETADDDVLIGLGTELQSLVDLLDARYVKGADVLQRDRFQLFLFEALYDDQRLSLPVRQFQSEHSIGAPVSSVWATLEDVELYPEWNPFTPRVETTFEIGSNIVMWVRLLRIFPDNLSIVTETVTDFEIEDRMCWESIFGSTFWMRSYRCYVVEAVSSEETVLRSTMVYEGLLAPLVEAFSRNFVMDGFNDVGDAIKDRLE